MFDDIQTLGRHETIHGLGASDARLILQGKGGQLYKEMMGLAPRPDFENKLSVQMGHATEDFNRFWCAKNTNTVALTPAEMEKDEHFKFTKIVDTNRDTRGFCHPVHEWLVVSPDGMLIHPEKGRLNFEAKHSNEWAAKNPQQTVDLYYPQIQVQMETLGLKETYLSVFYGNSTWEHYEIPFDADYIAEAMPKLEEFWKCILTETPPEGSSEPVEPLKQKGANPAAPVIYNMDESKSANMWASMAADYLKNEKSVKTFEKAKKALKEMMPDDATEIYGSGLQIKLSKSGSQLFSKHAASAPKPAE